MASLKHTGQKWWFPVATTVLALVLVPVGLGCSKSRGTSEQGLSGDPALPNCGFDLQEAAPTGDACSDGVTLLPAETYTRTTGQPDSFVRSFSTDQPGVICIQMLNGTGHRGDAVRSAKVTVDGEVVVASNSFGPGREASRTRTAIDSGEHSLGVTLAGKPGTKLSISVRFVIGQPPANRDFAFTNLRSTPASFSPDGNGVLDSTTLRALVDLDSTIPGNSASGATFEPRDAVFEIAAEASCQPVVALPLSHVTLTPGQPLVVSAPWNGADATGAVVGAGKYYFRVSGKLYRVQGGAGALVGAATSKVAAVNVFVDSTGGEQDEGLVIDVHPSPQVVPYSPPPETDARARAIQRLRASAPLIDAAFRGRLVSTRVERRTVPTTTGTITLPFIVGTFQLIDTWRNPGTLSGTTEFTAPLTDSAPRFVNNVEYAVFAHELPGELTTIDGNGSMLPYVSPNTVDFLGEQFSESELRALTSTDGAP